MSVVELWFMYVFLPSAKFLAGFSLVVVAGVTFFTSMAWAMEHDNRTQDKCKLVFKYSGASAAIALILFTLIPTKNDMYILTGAYIATNSDAIKQMPDNVAKTVNKYLGQLGLSNEQGK